MGSCGKLLLDQGEQSLESERIVDKGWMSYRPIKQWAQTQPTVPDEMGLRVPRELAGVTATLSPPSGHRDGECPW